MIVDTSAIVAIAKDEIEATRCLRRLAAGTSNRMSAATQFEAFLVVDRLDLRDARELVDTILRQYAIEIVPLTEQHVRLAREANLRFGTGSRQGSGLNFGDCFAYALAKQTGEPLLFVGNDFSRTDIEVA